jgi:DNA-binding transcriptional LysR family regulator
MPALDEVLMLRGGTSNIKITLRHKLEVMPLSLRQLELFRLVMQTRNVTETARLRRVSQPAVSQAIKDLENQLGLSLFVRSSGRISPTAEARALLREVERLFVQVVAVESHAAQLRDANAGSLAIAGLPTLTGSILPRAVAMLRAERPGVRITMNGYLESELIQKVRDESIDVGFLYGPVTDPNIVAEPIMESAMICLLPTGHTLAQQRSIRLKQLVGETVIMHPSTPPSILLMGRLAEAGMHVEATLEANQSFGAVALVRASVGIYVTEPLILMSELTSGLVARPFEPTVPQILAMVYSRHRPVPRLVVRFLTKLRAVIGEAAASLESIGVQASPL